MHYFGYLMIRLLAFLFWLIPFPLLYLISDGLAFLFYKVLGYRSEVVESNLKRCFPEKDEKEIKKIAHLSYRNLTDNILEVIKSFTLSLPRLRKRYVFKNPEVLDQWAEKGIPIMMCGSHYNNWEWGVQTADIDMKPQAYGVYKPLHNKPINNYFNKIRKRAGMRLLSMKETFGFIEDHQKEAGVYFFIADQSPSNHQRIHWVDFFNNETACSTGVDTLARQFNFPVYHYEVTRVRRGFYEVEYTEVCLDPSNKKEGEITQDFMNLLEKAIRKKPEGWLWSHKRWKLDREKIEAKHKKQLQKQ